MGSRAVAISSSGKHLYVASSGSDAITIFRRDPRDGELTQPSGQGGCVADRGASGCADARGLEGPNSVSLSPDGRFLYATSRDSSTVTIYRRNSDTGALTQLPGTSGCIAGEALPGCATAEALDGPDVITTTSDGKNVYVGSFFGSAVVVFQRDREGGTLTQPTDGTGCLVNEPTEGCTTAVGLANPEGMTVSGDGSTVFVAAPGSNAVLAFSRNPVDGSLAQVGGGYGCISTSTIEGCSTGRETSGANAVEVSPDDNDVYVTSLTSSSVTSFARSLSTGGIFQLAGPLGCVVWLGGDNCYRGRAMRSPEGIAFSPDDLHAYAVAYGTGGVAVLDRNPATGGLIQMRAPYGCVASPAVQGCERARALAGAGGIAVSGDGKFVYVTGAKANSLTVFRRVR